MALQSENGVQELRCSDSSDKRKKLDHCTLFGMAGTQDMKDANTSKKELKSSESECEPKFDLRKSLAWDNAFFTSPGFLEPEEFFQYWDNPNGWDIDRVGHEQHQIEESEMKSKATDQCNARASLAWDNAFLTSEGVLNPEELCLVNGGFKKSEMHVLSAIEELRVSSHSNCTTDSDASLLASLELQLFEDVKALSMNKKSGTEAKCKKIKKVHRAVKKMDGPTQLKVKSLANSRKQTGNLSQKIAKEVLTPPPSKQCSGGSGESNPSSSLKPPKTSGRPKSGTQMAPIKRVSLLANELKGESKNVHASNGKSLIVTTKPNSVHLKSLESKSDSPHSSAMRKKCSCMSPSVFSEGGFPKSSTCRDHRLHDYMTCSKGSCSAPREENGSSSVQFHASRSLKPSGLRLPSPKFGYFDEDEARSEGWKSDYGVQNGSGNRSRAFKDKDIMRSSKAYSQQTRGTTLGCSNSEEKSKYCLRNHKMKNKMVTGTQVQFCVKGKKPVLHREYQGTNTIYTKYDGEKQNLSTIQHHPQVLTTCVSGDVVIELSATQSPQGI